jgi:hypothetical protein
MHTDHARQCREHARRYLTECRSSLVEMAITQNWERNLEGLATSYISSFLTNEKRLPTMTELEDYRLPSHHVEYYRRHGRPHLKPVRDPIIAARAASGATAQPRNVTGDAA